MIDLLLAALAVLLLLLFLLCVKLLLLRRSIRALRSGVKERLEHETNTLLTLPGRDREMRRLASELNEELRALRTERRRCQEGDRALKEAVTNISHDLRTPLTALSGYVELLKSQPLPEKARRYAAQIEERTAAMKRLTDELFRYFVSASGELKTEEVDLRRAVEEALLSFYGALQERNITPVLQLTEASVVRRLDPTALSRVLGNILSNVLKYSAGDLNVSLDEMGEITFSNRATDLDPVAVGRLFDRFYTVESGCSATGLGLSIAKTLTEQMGGNIGAVLLEGRFCISLLFPPEPSSPAR